MVQPINGATDPYSAHADSLAATAPGLTADDLSDALTVIMTLSLEAQNGHDNAARTQTEGTNAVKSQARAREFEDLQKQIKALGARGFFDSIGHLAVDVVKTLVDGNFDKLGQDFKDMADSPQFWNDLAKVGAVVAEIASTIASVASFGSASASTAATTALTVGVLLSACGMVEQNGHVLENLTGDKELSKWFSIGCMIGSALCEAGGGIADLLTKGGEEATKKAAELAEVVRDRIKAAMEATANAGNVVAAIGQGGTAVTTYVAAENKRDIEHHRQVQAQMQGVVDDIIAQLKHETESTNKDQKVVYAAIDTKNNTQLIAASILRA